MQGSYGDLVAFTANLEKLASEEIQFTNAYSTASGIKDKVTKFHQSICERFHGKWKGYDL